ncbi:MAG: CaiB/BaiF CoA transferase family protein [Gammaproteobacteria bacterium]
MMEANRAALGPRVFDDVRVLDFTGVIAGPYCTRMMADLGADVLKVEPPAGELMRHIAPLRGDESTVFASLNCGKRSLVLDLKQPAAVAICKLLVTTYDVVVENFSPGVMRRLGLGYEDLVAENPRLIMCSISGYGQTGPGAERPAFAPIVQALSGFDLVTLGNQPGLDRPLNMGLPVADTTASQQAFGAISAALYYRARTGIGQYIDIAMLDSLLSTMHRDFQAAFHPDRIDRLYGPIAARDGFVILMPLTQSQFGDLCVALGRQDLLDDPRFASMRARLDNYNALMAIAEQWAHTRTVSEAVRALEAAGIPCAPYRSVNECADDPQLHHRGMLTEVVDAAGPLKVPNTPFLYSATQAAVRPEVATLGQHSHAVLTQELELPPHDIEALVAAGVTNPAT